MIKLASSMTDNKEIVHRFVDYVLNGKRPEAINELTTKNMTTHQLGMGNVRKSRGEFEEFNTGFRNAVPNLKFTINESVGEDNLITLYMTISGTPEKQYGAITPTGKSFEIPGFQMYHVENGRIDELWILPNVVGTMQQLDLMPDSPRKILRLMIGQLRGRLP